MSELGLLEQQQLSNKTRKAVFCTECSHERSIGHTMWRIDRDRNLLICLQCGSAWRIYCSNGCGGVDTFCESCGEYIFGHEVTCVHCGRQRQCDTCHHYPEEGPHQKVDLRNLFKEEVIEDLPGTHININEDQVGDLPGEP